MPFAWAVQDESAANLELVKLLANVATMQADFVQFPIGEKKLGIQQKIYGKMYLQRPGKFRWEAVKPIKQLIVADGKFVWVYDADLEQVTKRKINYNEAGNPAMLLSGSTESLQNSFTIMKVESMKQTVSFQLKPQTENNIYQKIKLNFINGVITSMIMIDNLGQQNQINFTNVKINTPLSSNLFKFVPSKGIDVIENV